MSAYQIYFLSWSIGLISGFTIMLSGNTLNFWLSVEGIDIRTIGIFALVSLPYAINFLWAPIFDTKKIPIISKSFGHRVSWIICFQLLLSCFVYLLSIKNPGKNIVYFAIISLFISFFASAQDTLLGALKTEVIKRSMQGQIAGIYIFGYRFGMLLSGYCAIYVSSFMNFNIIYKIFSLILLIFPLLLILSSSTLNKEMIQNTDVYSMSELSQNALIGRIKSFIIQILQPTGSLKYISYILIFLILYRIADNFIVMMINPFMLKIGYTTLEIANAGKLFGIISAIIGGLVASYIMKKIKIIDCLMIFGAIHAFSHLSFLLQEIYGKNIYLLFFVIGFEGVTSGMTMAAYIAFIASLCHGKFRATQYSFFSSMMGLSRSILPSISGYLVTNVGWNIFFILMFILALLPLFISWYFKRVDYIVN